MLDKSAGPEYWTRSLDQKPGQDILGYRNGLWTGLGCWTCLQS